MTKRCLVQTFGCQMNVHDSERIEAVLATLGYESTDEAQLADVLVLNTCSVREKAEHKLMSMLGTLRPLKDSKPGLAIVVAGCVAQQEGERLLKKAPYIDLIIGPDNIADLPALLREHEGGGPPAVRTVFDVDAPQFLAPAASSEIAAPVAAFVTVMKGCDERCTYCVVPYTRGPERYRDADGIVAEIAGLVARGTREVTLLGQTVNSWFEEVDQAPRQRTSQFAALLRRIAREVPGLARLRYTSSHPRHVSDELVEAHRDLPVLPRHVHLPVQSGSDRVLRRMLRRYTRALYLERVRALQAAVPGLTMSTDLIVGFPGETEADFEETLSLVREAGFVAAFGFKYSPRPHTPALNLADDVPEEVKDERLARLFALVAEQQTAHLESRIGEVEEVLVEGPSRDAPTRERRFTGRSGRHEIVHVDVPRGVDPTGHVVPVRIERAFKHSLLGTLIGEPPRARVRRRPAPLPVLSA